MNNILGIIPARYASTRFPGKPLADINGRSMILRVYEQALKARVFTDVIVATDDDRIFSHVESAGYHAVMTSSSHRSGTDRCLEALETWEKTRKSHYNYIVNIQGDEPYIHPEQIKKVADLLTGGEAQIATLARLITHRDDIFNPNVVKVVCNKDMNAMYFSRSPVPFIRGVDDSRWIKAQAHYKHIGIYGFKSETLKKAAVLPEGTLEIHESLEQLRWLEYGLSIKIGLTDYESVAIDTPDDLLKITNMA
jgi:3-deoxy-manno-octulosonate cytidylyltransferase (CMP-KDO synthetase)